MNNYEYNNANGAMNENSSANSGSNVNKKEGFPKPGPVAAIVVALFEIVIAFFGLTYAQYYWGMWGLVVTEITFVVISIGAAWVVGLDLKEMMPLRSIKVNQFFGTIVMWGGALLFMMLMNLVFFYFFPEGMSSNAQVTEFTKQWPAAASLFVVAVMPAICEEMLHRGFIQRCIMRKVHNPFLISFIMALFFGFFHMDFYRFLGTAFLGGVIAYILVITDNFWYNMLFHFTNNLFAQVLSIIAGNEAVQQAANDATAITKDMLPPIIAIYCIIGSAAPILMLGGSMLLKGTNRLKAEGKKKLIASIVTAVIIAGVLFVFGCILFGYLVHTGQLDKVMEGLK